MPALRVILSKAWKEDNGATMVEYAFMISLIAITAFAGVATFGNAVLDLYQNIRDEIVVALR
jgi:Flp pilus assembly pilin Flp